MVMAQTLAPGARPVTGLPTALFANAMIALAVFLGGFVIREPAPYELFLIVMIIVWYSMGLRIARAVLPLIICYFAYNVGGVLASLQMEHYGRGLLYVVVSVFLALSSVFFASVIMLDARRLRLIMRAYVVGAMITAMLGILGYFGAIPGAALFTRYDRAMGAFQDPNVFGPFLVMPILYLGWRLITCPPLTSLLRAIGMLILLLALFLAFSRAAWGLIVVTMVGMYFLSLVTTHSNRDRWKLVLVAAVGTILLALMLVVALQFDVIYDMFAQRARIVQDYDAGHFGRFERYSLGYQLALEHPLGIGPLEFGFLFGEDTHNNGLKALMAHGWIGFVSLMILFVWTLVAGFKPLFRPRPWQRYLQIAYVAFAGHLLVGMVVDTDHWRHFYLMIGIIWGCIGLEQQWQYANAGRVAPLGNSRRLPGLA